MVAEVDISQKGGKMLADAPRATAMSQTQVYSKLDQGADAEVDRIVAANLGRGATAGSVAPAAARSALPAASAGNAAQGASSQSHPG
jgi:membrane fusion protein (multidrug efflux system)